MMKSLIMVSDRATSFRPWQPCGWVRTGAWIGVGGSCQSWFGEVNPGISPSKIGFSSQLSLEGQGLQ